MDDREIGTGFKTILDSIPAFLSVIFGPWVKKPLLEWLVVKPLLEALLIFRRYEADPLRNFRGALDCDFCFAKFKLFVFFLSHTFNYPGM